MMTTIATDGRTIASDGKITENNIIIDLNHQKLFRLPDGRIAGIAGDTANAEYLIGILVKGTDEEVPPETFKGVAVMIIDGSDTIETYADSHHPVMCPAPYSTGTGSQIALGAMLAGKSPVEAVKIAAQRDIYSGGKVRSMTAKPRT